MNTTRMTRNAVACAILAAVVAGLAVSCGGGGGDNGGSMAANTTTVSATLTNDQEMFDATPPTASGATGTGTATVNKDNGAISGSFVIDGIPSGDVTMAHIHQGEAGTTGPIIIAMTRDASDPNKWNVPSGTMLTSAQLNAFLLGDLYFNAHTTANANGEIRGQIGREVFTAVMTSPQERLADGTATASAGTGKGVVALDPTSKIITASFHVDGLSGAATAGHIHDAAAGVTGPIIIPMVETPSGSGTFAATLTLSAGQLTDLHNGNMYFNAHTAANTNGEIRGQIGRAVRIAEPLSGDNQVPMVASSGSGSGFATLDRATRMLSGSMSINDITPTMAHIHSAGVGANGPIIVPFTTTGSASPFSASGSGSVSVDDAKAFLDGNTYMNVHTSAHMDGEIRGQLDIP